MPRDVAAVLGLGRGSGQSVTLSGECVAPQPAHRLCALLWGDSELFSHSMVGFAKLDHLGASGEDCQPGAARSDDDRTSRPSLPGGYRLSGDRSAQVRQTDAEFVVEPDGTVTGEQISQPRH
jgi:hypothetical protein